MASIVMSSRWLRSLSWSAFAVVVAIMLVLAGYAGLAYSDALADAVALRARADALVASGRGPQTLGLRRLEQVIQLKDPNFWSHHGVDGSGLGSGGITLTQTLIKPAPFDVMVPSVSRLRQDIYAYALETRLSKMQILALYFEQAKMGQGKAGALRGVFAASRAVYGRAPADLTNAEWYRLLATINAPRVYHWDKPDAGLDERVARLTRFLNNDCQPDGAADVNLDGCVG